MVTGKKLPRAPGGSGDENRAAEIAGAARRGAGGRGRDDAPFGCWRRGRGGGRRASVRGGHGGYYRGTTGGLVTDTRLSLPSLSDTSSDSPGRV